MPQRALAFLSPLLFSALLAACGSGGRPAAGGDAPESPQPSPSGAPTQAPVPTPPVGAAACAVPPQGADSERNRLAHWAPIWSSGIAPLDGTGFDDQTIRNIVTTHWEGERLRVRLSNRFGERPLVVSSAWLGRQAEGAALQPGSNVPLLFGGQGQITLAPGTQVVSDVVEFPVQAFEALAVSLHLPQATGLPTGHDFAQATSFITESGDHAADEAGAAYTQTTERWHFVAGIDGFAPQQRNVVVAFGDSITEGLNSTTDANRRYPDVLQRRIRAELPAAEQMIVVNKGISGNRVLTDGALPGQGRNALARMNWDVLARRGVTDVIFMEGINDLGLSPYRSAEEIIAGITQVATRIRAAGIHLIGSTLMPATTFFIPSYGALAEQEAKRQQINAYIRSSGIYDQLVDWDRVMEDPARPGVLNPDFDSGDGLHPNDAGYAAMAAAIDLQWLRGRTAPKEDAQPAKAGPVPATAWSTSMMPAPGAVSGQQTLRMIVHPHASGSAPRVRLSNRYGSADLTLGPVTIARAADGAAVDPDSLRPVTFNGGDTQITLPPGADAISDAVADFEVDAFTDLAVSIHVPAGVPAVTGHVEAHQRSFIAPGGDHTGDTQGLPFAVPTTSWFYLQGIDVISPQPVRTVVALGDSITDGSSSTVNANQRWPDILQRRLAQTPGCEHVVVLNAGIGANKILTDTREFFPSDSAQRRIDGDVFLWPQVRDVILLEGTNDLGFNSASADAVVQGLELLRNRVHAQGMRLLVSPQTPASNPGLHGSPDNVAARNAINCWTRENAPQFDGFIDFEQAVAAPDDPEQMDAQYDSGDGLHPNDAGYTAMADAVDLSLICR